MNGFMNARSERTAVACSTARAATLALASALLALSSCASTAIQVGYWNREPSGLLGKPIYVFGGTIADAVVTVRSLGADDESSIGVLMILDLPFSLVADVVLLPLCIYEQIERTTWEEDEFIARLADPDAETRARAARALGELEGTTDATVEALTKALADVEPSVRCSALSALAELGTRSARAAPAVLELLRAPNAETRASAATVLGTIGADPSAAIPALIGALQDASVRVRFGAVESLARIGTGDPAVIAALQRASGEDEEPSVREAARAALHSSARQVE